MLLIFWWKWKKMRRGVVYFWTDFKGAFHTVFIQSPTYEGSSIFTEHRDIYSLYIENKTTNKNNHLFYSSKKEETKREICIFTSFFQITRHIIYGTLRISHSWSILLDLISVKIKVYRHLSPRSLTHSLLRGRATHTHTHGVWPGWTNCMADTLLPLAAAGWKQETASPRHHIHSMIRTVEPTWLPLKKCKGQTLVCGSAWKNLNINNNKKNTFF